MIKQTLDLHIHSKYSRACSKDLELAKIVQACQIKGVDIISTGDFTHPQWFEHINECLVEENEGIYSLKSETQSSDSRKGTWSPRNFTSQTNPNLQNSKARFLIGTELACIKKHKEQTRRLHLNVYAPNIEAAKKFNGELEHRGFNLKSDGRPILGLTAKELLQIMLEVDERMIMVPAHVWTPWFGLFGSKGGYDSIGEAFEELADRIFAIETGLSSDPLMNWRLSMLDKIALVSNSDAHSLEKIGREANVMEFASEKEVTYQNIFKKIKNREMLYTIEFFPEEGKYHFDGHRDCQFVCRPEETMKLKGICPKCKKSLVIGVMNRVVELADRSEDQARSLKNRVPYKNLVPLAEILANVFDAGVKCKTVKSEYENLIKNFGSEFNILLHGNISEIENKSSKNIAEAIDRVRKGNIYVSPGYDGEFGKVKVFCSGNKPKQLGIEI